MASFSGFLEHLYFEMHKLCLRAYIKTGLLLGVKARQIHVELTTAYGQDVVSYRTVAHWIDRFLKWTRVVRG